MELDTYRRKRDFDATPEPRGVRAKKSAWSYVVQKHAARRLHFDFRLELGGVLLSWAVPKGPSMDPSIKRLAMQTEDHPVAYGAFEGVIPAGEYGGGTVMLWDQGTWSVQGGAAAAKSAYEKGRLTFTLHGKRLTGRWHLVRAQGSDARGERAWLLFKGRDGASAEDEEPVEVEHRSVTTRRTMAEIAAAADRVWRSRGGGEAASTATPPELPPFTPPSLATLVRAAPPGDDWLHEIKLDGYRIVARLRRNGPTELHTRSGKNWTGRFPQVASALSRLDVDSASLDGEAVVFDKDGVSRFQLREQRRGHPDDPRGAPRDRRSVGDGVQDRAASDRDDGVPRVERGGAKRQVNRVDHRAVRLRCGSARECLRWQRELQSMRARVSDNLLEERRPNGKEPIVDEDRDPPRTAGRKSSTRRGFVQRERA